jgi:hypothetical protein
MALQSLAAPTAKVSLSRTRNSDGSWTESVLDGFCSLTDPPSHSIYGYSPRFAVSPVMTCTTGRCAIAFRRLASRRRVNFPSGPRDSRKWLAT